MNYTIQNKNFDIRRTFLCGQCFRWSEDENGAFSGIAGGRRHLFHRVGSRPTQCAPRLGGGQCHGTGLRTSGRKLHLAVQDPNEHVLFHIRFIFLFFRLRFVQSDSFSSSYSPGIPEQKSFSAHDPSLPEMAGHFIPYCFLLCILMGRLLLPC